MKRQNLWLWRYALSSGILLASTLWISSCRKNEPDTSLKYPMIKWSGSYNFTHLSMTIPGTFSLHTSVIDQNNSGLMGDYIIGKTAGKVSGVLQGNSISMTLIQTQPAGCSGNLVAIGLMKGNDLTLVLSGKDCNAEISDVKGTFRKS